MNAQGELELIFPTEEYKIQVEEYLQEHFDNGEYVLHGDAGLDEIKDFDKWLEKVRNEVNIEDSNLVPATLFLAVRKSDNRVVGTIQIRHRLNEKLLIFGHIGDGVRPSERNKGYASEMIRLALEECKKLNIHRVLISCNKDNIASAKSIIKNGGVLENEVMLDDGKVEQRYWISLKKRFADGTKNFKNVIEVDQKIQFFDDEVFTGDVFISYFKNTSAPYFLSSGLKIQDNDYKYLEFYNYSKRIKLTAVYTDKNEIVEWYFDIARGIGKENGIPYEDDMYLDVVLNPEGKAILIDQDEYDEAFKQLEMTKDEYNEGYKIANELLEKVDGKADEMKQFTDRYLKIMLEKIKN